MRALAIDLGGGHATCAVIEDRKILCDKVIAFRDSSSLAKVLPELTSTCMELLNSLGSPRIDVLAFGFCGLVDTKQNRILSVNGRYFDGPEVNLDMWARESLQTTLFLENDARMALLGERHAGAGQSSDDVAMMTFGTGIGTAAVMEGRLVRGRHFQAGCLGGHFSIALDGQLCSCGNIGCVETVASGWALDKICRGWPGVEKSTLGQLDRIGFAELMKHANAGDETAKAIASNCLKAWSAAAVSLIHAYDPEILILGGGVIEGDESSEAPSLVDEIRKSIHTHAWTPWGKVRVAAAQLGNRAALLGAVPLILERRAQVVLP